MRHSDDYRANYSANDYKTDDYRNDDYRNDDYRNDDYRTNAWRNDDDIVCGKSALCAIVAVLLPE